MMFAQANSEHCRHKIFNAELVIDGQPQPQSLFQMIRRSTEASPAGVLSAYSDNAAVIEGLAGRALLPRSGDRRLRRARRAGAHPDEGRDAQPPDGDLAVPGRGHRLGRRDPRRGGDGAGRAPEGGADRLLGVEPAPAGRRAPWEERPSASPTASPARSTS